MSPADSGQPEARAAALRLRPRLGPADYLVHLWRAKWLMLLVFLPLFALGLIAALMLPERYTATARLLVSPPAAQAYDPEGQARAEIELLRSSIVVKAAVEKVSVAKAFPAISARCIGEDCVRAGVETVLAGLETEAVTGGRAVSLAYTHPDPAIAAEMLGALTRAYLDYRPAFLGEEPALSFGAQRERFEGEVADAEAAIRSYLAQNGLTGLETQRDTLGRLYEAANLELISASSRKAQLEAQLSSLRSELSAVEASGMAYADNISKERLQALYVQREELRARMAPNAPALRDLDERIARIEALIGRQAESGDTRRLEVSPLYTDIQGTIARLEAELRAASRQQAELHSQIASLEARDQQIQELAPGLAELQRRRDVAAQAASRYASQAAEARARSYLARDGAGDVRLLETVAVPRRGHSWRVPAAFGAFGVAALCAFLAGLFHALAQRGFVTPRAIERTVGVPVLATVRAR